MSRSRSQDLLLLMGDFNAKFGEDVGLWKGKMGVFGIGQRNNNSQRLLEFCNMNKLIVANTEFNHRNIHKCTIGD